MTAPDSGLAGFLGRWLSHLGGPGRPSTDARDLTQRTRAALAAEDHVEARGLASALLARDPDDAFALYVRATASQHLGEPAPGRADAERLLTLSPEVLRRGGVDGGAWRARTWLLVGMTAQALDDEPAAEAAFAAAEATEGCAPDTLFRLRAWRWDLAGALAAMGAPWGMALRQLGRFDEARAAYDEALAAARGPEELVRIRGERWELRTILGDAGAMEELAALPDRPERWGLVGVASALAGDRDAARAAFERATVGTLGVQDAWQWAVSLGLRPATDPPPARDAWQAAITALLLGGLDDDDLLALARAASGPRLRTWRLHEAHVGLSLLACGRGDAELELHHLRAAAAFGDLGGLLSPWIHGRARRLGSPVEHRPPTLAEA